MRRALLVLTALLTFSEPPIASGRATDVGGLGGVKLLQVTLPTRDLARSVPFYRDVLGLRLLFEVRGAAFFDINGVRLRLEASRSAPSQGAELYFDDPGLSKAAVLRSRGVRFIGPPETVLHNPSSDLKLLEFLDPDGNALALIGETPR